MIKHGAAVVLMLDLFYKTLENSALTVTEKKQLLSRSS